MRNLIFLGFLILLTGCVKSNPDLTAPLTTPLTPLVTIPNAPTNLKGVVSKSTQIDLTWTDNSDNEEGFKIERKSGTDAYKLIATLNSNVMTYSDKSIVDPTNYMYRIFSYHQKGNSTHSNEINLATIVTDVDGNKYTFVQIGQQVWMDKNLEVETYRNGDVIPQVTDAKEWAALKTGAWCYHSNNKANGVIYGKLYNWYAVNDPRGLAPKGWHIPNNAEWTILTTFLGGTSVAGGKMKSTGTSRWDSPNFGATNESGFSGLPGNTRYNIIGTFGDLGNFGVWWSAESATVKEAWSQMLEYRNERLDRVYLTMESGYSVRCLKDDSTKDN
jgi:uncharacterized protein (TIGR02145 family)